MITISNLQLRLLSLQPSTGTANLISEPDSDLQGEGERVDSTHTFETKTAITILRVHIIIIAHTRFDEQRERLTEFDLHADSRIPGGLPAVDS